MRRTRIFAFIVGLVMTAAACGQHAGVHARGGFAGPGGGVVDDSGAIVDPGTGEVIDPGTGAPVDNGGGVDAGGGTAGPNTPDQTGPQGPGDVNVAGDRTGITAKTITIGLHAPLTGAAPITPSAFNKGKDLYWKWLKTKGVKVLGRDVEVVFADDHYNPTTAVAVCNEMATSKRAFLLIGGGGTDQINACAGYAQPRGIPYLSPGVQESGLSKRKTYFAVSMTYAQQMPILVELLKKENSKTSMDKYGGPGGGPDGKILVGHVRPNTPNFNDAEKALKDSVLAAGWRYKSYSVVKEGNSSEAKTVAANAQNDGVDILLPITAPTFTVQLALNAESNTYKPQWGGVGISDNLNAFMDSACKNANPSRATVDGALFLSPWAGWKQVMQGEYDPEFRQAADMFAKDVNTRRGGGDIVLALWGIMKTVHQALLAAGPNVTRQSFIQTMGRFQLSTKVFPDLAFTPGNPFGAQNAHVLLGKCSEGGDPDNGVQAGAMFIEHPEYPGLRNRF